MGVDAVERLLLLLPLVKLRTVLTVVEPNWKGD